ncbi:MAG: hypothetical protein GEU97_18740 [Actinophytocola sp.]|nr:hypothetical protein [Actinophytocola sp.]
MPPPENGANAGVREPARAKESTQPQQHSQPADVTLRSRLGDLATRVGTLFTPPNPRTTSPPSWDQLIEYGDRGRQAPKDGWPRTLSVLWSRVVALPGRALAIWLDWITRCPSRSLVALVLYALLAHLPGMGWLPWFY